MFFVIDASTIFSVLFIIFLECILSMDNALVLAMMVKHLEPAQRRRALTYGIWGAFIFRFISLFALSYLMGMNWIKWAGGGYLLFIAAKNLIFGEGDSEKPHHASAFSFWRTVLAVEIMDIAFSIDSILAATALTQNYIIVLMGGIIGIVAMRFAATMFVGLLNRFPSLNTMAYLLVGIIGIKLVLQGFGVDFHSSKSPASWIFWFSMLGCTIYGFRSPKVKCCDHSHKETVNEQ
jgi:YkoY family integral membrane protein